LKIALDSLEKTKAEEVGFDSTLHNASVKRTRSTEEDESRVDVYWASLEGTERE